MKVINIDVLRPGDIILTTSNEKVSSAVRKATSSDISHAMLYVAAGSVMDSTGAGVQAKNIQKLFYDDDCAIYVLRLRTRIPDRTLDDVIRYVRHATATPYTKREAILSAASRLGTSKATRKQFCSRLVARAYASVGIQLHPAPDFCTPEDLKQSPLLEPVENPSREISEEEMNELREVGDATVGMAEVSNKLLRLAQQVCSEVMSINDIHGLAIQRPELDAGFADAYRKSGYLNYWRTEEVRFPWRYDIGLMFAMQKKLEAVGRLVELVDYCNDTLEHQRQGVFDHWHENAQQIAILIRAYPRETLRLMGELYDNLTRQNNARIAVVEAWKLATGY